MNRHEYIHNKKSILEQFRIFCINNNISNFEIAVEFFAVFGGLNRQIDCSKSLQSQIEIHILKRYKYLRDDISAISKGDEQTHKVLSSIALGDRRTNSAFKRSKVSFDDGIDIVDKQCKLGMLKLEKSLFRFTNKKEDLSISEKLIFTTPFSHFWFAFVSPIFRGIRDGDFIESLNNFENKKVELISFVYEQLCYEVIIKSYQDDKIKTIGRYWDNNGDIINLLVETKSGKVIVGSIKYTNKKIKKSTFTQLKNLSQGLGIKADSYILFSKKGFTNELKSIKNDNLKLLTVKNISYLS
jgi:hypothetical protein